MTTYTLPDFDALSVGLNLVLSNQSPDDTELFLEYSDHGVSISAVYSEQARGHYFEGRYDVPYQFKSLTLSPYLAAAFDYGYASNHNGFNHFGFGLEAHFKWHDAVSSTLSLNRTLPSSALKELGGEVQSYLTLGLNWQF